LFFRCLAVTPLIALAQTKQTAEQEPGDKSACKKEALGRDGKSCVAHPKLKNPKVRSEKFFDGVFGQVNCTAWKTLRSLKSITHIVLHDWESASATGAFKRWWCHGWGSHYLVFDKAHIEKWLPACKPAERDCEVLQISDERLVQNHTTDWSGHTIGIDLQYPACRSQEGRCKGFTDAQYAALNRLIKTIIGSGQTSISFDDDRIVGHCETTRTGHHDPSDFDWSKVCYKGKCLTNARHANGNCYTSKLAPGEKWKGSRTVKYDTHVETLLRGRWAIMLLAAKGMEATGDKMILGFSKRTVKELRAAALYGAALVKRDIVGPKFMETAKHLVDAANRLEKALKKVEAERKKQTAESKRVAHEKAAPGKTKQQKGR
jgi:hypothetical protein